MTGSSIMTELQLTDQIPPKTSGISSTSSRCHTLGTAQTSPLVTTGYLPNSKKWWQEYIITVWRTCNVLLTQPLTTFLQLNGKEQWIMILSAWGKSFRRTVFQVIKTVICSLSVFSTCCMTSLVHKLKVWKSFMHSPWSCATCQLLWSNTFCCMRKSSLQVYSQTPKWTHIVNKVWLTCPQNLVVIHPFVADKPDQTHHEV